MSGALPTRIRIVEVGPRDGFQMEQRLIPVETKIALVERLAAAGLRSIEATSFVHPEVIPQLADAAEVLGGVDRQPDTEYLALVPNLVGARRALAAGADGLRQVICVTETYNQRNVGRSVDRSIEIFGDVVAAARAAEPAVPASAVLGVVFGCPFEGQVPVERVVEIARRVVDAGSVELGLADSAGLGNPRLVQEVVEAVRAAVPEVPLWLHLHDTRGFGIANAMAGLEAGVTTFDTAFGGLGGCPIMRGATGNIATEDLAYLCDQLGIATGVDLDAVREASRSIGAFLERSLPSRVLAAGTHAELIARQQPAE